LKSRRKIFIVQDNLLTQFLFSENGFCIKDSSKKYAGQTITPRHTIDAILGLNKLGGIFQFLINLNSGKSEVD
jgi:hypothetical protein